MAEWQRTHTCGALCEAHNGETVTLNGWVNTVRGYSQQIFVDLRDRYGVTQVVFEADAAELFKQAAMVGREWVLSVTGRVRERLPGKHNANLPTGAVELEAKSLKILNKCPTPPFEVTEFPGEEIANEDLRLQYRYLDLRRPSLQRTLELRHRLNKVIRDYLDEKGFLELETPLLGRSSPEGAGLLGAESRVGRDVLCAAPVAATVQATFDGGRLRQVFPNRALPARRGFAPTASRSSRSWTSKCPMSSATTC